MSGPAGRGADATELRSLNLRVIELERERADAREQARLLMALQHAFTTISVTRTPDQIVAHMLRAAYDPLGFSRALYFGVDRERGIEARFELDGSDVVEPSTHVPNLETGSSILSLLRKESMDGSGTAGELSAPLVDVRHWYVLSALAHAEGTFGILYVDGHRSRVPREWETGLVRALATIASVAIENSVLFARTQELATRDPLTGLLNRRAFGERLLAEIEACRLDGGSLTYVMIDVDNFKGINDTYGHAHGDRVLRHLAETLASSSRTEDIVGRYAGDEFVVLLCNIDPELSRSLVTRLSNELKAQHLSCSLGAALFPKDARDAAELLAAADRALYATKAAGKNGFAFA